MQKLSTRCLKNVSKLSIPFKKLVQYKITCYFKKKVIMK